MSESRHIKVNLDDRVGYRVIIRGSRAARCRLGTCIIDHDLLVTKCYEYSDETTVLIVYADPSNIEDIEEDLKALDVEYSGPTYFDNGSIDHVYATPEDELDGKPSQRYVAWKEKKKDQRRDRGMPGDTRELCRLLYWMVVDRSSVKIPCDHLSQWLAMSGWDRVESAQRSSDSIGYVKGGERIWITPGEEVSPRALYTVADVEGTSVQWIQMRLVAGLESIDDIEEVPGA